MRALPLVGRCGEDFAAMRGDERARHCDRCGLHVHDLSSRTEEDAAALLESKDAAPVCVRFAVGRDGNIRFRAAVIGAVAMTIAASSVALASSTTPSPTQPTAKDAGLDSPADVEHWMGRK